MKYHNGIQDNIFGNFRRGQYCSRTYVFTISLLLKVCYILLLHIVNDLFVIDCALPLKMLIFLTLKICNFFFHCKESWTPPNLALNKPTAQSSTYIHHNVPLSAEYAVDGIQHRSLTTTRPCAHTDGGTYPWWVVDLGQSSLVSEVWIVSRIYGKFIGVCLLSPLRLGMCWGALQGPLDPAPPLKDACLPGLPSERYLLQLLWQQYNFPARGTFYSYYDNFPTRGSFNTYY